MDGGAWWTAAHGIPKSRTQLSDFTFTFTLWRRKWQPTPVFLPGESQGWGSLVGCRLQAHTESDTTEVMQQQQQQEQENHKAARNGGPTLKGLLHKPSGRDLAKKQQIKKCRD